MCIRYLGFVLLIWFSGALHGQSAPQSCSGPSLDGGFFAPKQDTYPHGAQLAYTCDTGRKATVKGWWATSKCQDGKWSHEPQCIDEKACIPPTIPNAKYTENSNGWYEEGHIIRITCAKGYQDKNWDATAECRNGTWSSVLVCEKSLQACDAPPKIPHAVIINQEYQDVFAADSEVQYECEDGFTVEGADTKKSIICIAGSWTTGPTCRSSTTSEKDRGPEVTIDNCRKHPNVPNGDVVQEELMFLKYQCNAYYTRVGPEKVMCYNDGTWSDLPVCKETFCVIDPAQLVGKHFELSGPEHMKEGQMKQVPCTWEYYSGLIKCTNGKISVTRCCHRNDQHRTWCRELHPLSG